METEHAQPTPDVLYELTDSLLRNTDPNLQKSFFRVVEQLKIVDDSNYVSILIEKIQLAKQSNIISEDLSLDLLDIVRNA